MVCSLKRIYDTDPTLAIVRSSPTPVQNRNSSTSFAPSLRHPESESSGVVRSIPESSRVIRNLPESETSRVGRKQSGHKMAVSICLWAGFSLNGVFSPFGLCVHFLKIYFLFLISSSRNSGFS